MGEIQELVEQDGSSHDGSASVTVNVCKGGVNSIGMR